MAFRLFGTFGNAIQVHENFQNLTTEALDCILNVDTFSGDKTMHIHIKKWGNSLALRLPKPFTKEVHIKEGSTVDATVKNGKIFFVPLKQPKYTLKALLSGITKKNTHQEIDYGQAMGQEAW